MICCTMSIDNSLTLGALHRILPTYSSVLNRRACTFINFEKKFHPCMVLFWSALEWVIRSELTLWKGCVILANEGHSEYWEWPLLARITQPFYSVNSSLHVYWYWYIRISLKQDWMFWNRIGCSRRVLGLSNPELEVL